MAHSKKKKEANKRWAQANGDKMRRYRRKWNKRNQHAKREIQRAWRARNPEKIAIYNARRREWYKAHGLKASWRVNEYPAPTHPAPDRCECCGGQPSGVGARLQLDHCHAPRRFRGWLCHRCNLGIGSLGDSVEGLTRAITYLQRT